MQYFGLFKRESFSQNVENIIVIQLYQHAENLMIIMEYTPYGDLLGFMRKSRGMEDRHRIGEQLNVTELSNYDLVKFARQVACGMQFLKSRGVNI